MKKNLIIWGTLVTLAVVSLGVTQRIQSHRLDEVGRGGSDLWQGAIVALQSGDFARAKAAFGEWIAWSQGAQLTSPEAHFNLALAHGQAGEAARSSQELLTVLSLSPSLGLSLRAQSLLGELQRKMGVTDSVLKEGRFRLQVWFTRERTAWLLTLAFWLAVAGLLAFVKFRNQRPRWERLVWMAPSLCLGVLGLLALLSHTSPGVYAIVLGNGESVPLYSAPRGEAQEKLLDLPSGSLVHRTGEIQNGLEKIDSPILAWMDPAGFAEMGSPQ